jgi:hypothetical protein
MVKGCVNYIGEGVILDSVFICPSVGGLGINALCLQPHD